VYAEDAPLELRTVSTVRILRWVWLQNYVPIKPVSVGAPRMTAFQPAMRFISSPYHLDTHYAVKRTNSRGWLQGPPDRDVWG
jgi:hypothetical protein